MFRPACSDPKCICRPSRRTSHTGGTGGHGCKRRQRDSSAMEGGCVEGGDPGKWSLITTPAGAQSTREQTLAYVCAVDWCAHAWRMQATVAESHRWVGWPSLVPGLAGS